MKKKSQKGLAALLCAALLCAGLGGCSCQPEPGGDASSVSGTVTTAPTTGTAATAKPTVPTTAVPATPLSLTRADCRSVGISLAVYYYTAAYAPGDEALQEAVAGALDTLYADGTIDGIGDKWFRETVFPRDDGIIPYPSAADESWNRVKNAGVLAVGANPNAAPLSFRDGSGVWHGYEIDVVRAVTGKLGVAVTFTAVDAADAVEALTSHRVDCMWGGFRYDSALRRDVLYCSRTEWMLEDSIAYYTLRDSSFDGESDLWSRDVTMVTPEGSFSEQFIRDRMQGEPVNAVLRTEPTPAACFTALQEGDAFAVVTDDLTALYTLK